MLFMTSSKHLWNYCDKIKKCLAHYIDSKLFAYAWIFLLLLETKGGLTYVNFFLGMSINMKPVELRIFFVRCYSHRVKVLEKKFVVRLVEKDTKGVRRVFIMSFRGQNQTFLVHFSCFVYRFYSLGINSLEVDY